MFHVSLPFPPPPPIPSLSLSSSLFSLLSSQYKAEELEGDCISGLLLQNKLAQNRQLKTIHRCYFTIPVAQEFRAGLVRFSASGSHQAAVKVLTGLCSHLKAHLGKNLLPGSIRLLAESTSLQLYD